MFIGHNAVAFAAKRLAPRTSLGVLMAAVMLVDLIFTLFQPTWFRKAPWEDPADYAGRSPITYIDRVKTPLMLIEGEADYRTPPWPAER